VKTAVLQYTVVQYKCLQPFGVSEDLTVKAGHPEHGADKRRSSSEYELNSVTWCPKAAH
jgi:hypothetical protein